MSSLVKDRVRIEIRSFWSRLGYHFPYRRDYNSNKESWRMASLEQGRNFLHLIISISRNSAVFYWKSANLIGSPTVFYSLIENSRARVAPRPVVSLDFWL